MVLDNVTLFEVHLATDRFASDDGDDSTSRDRTVAPSRTERDEDDSSGGRSIVGLLAGTVVLAAIALGVRRLRSGGSDTADERAYRQPDVDDTEVDVAPEA